MSNSRKKRKQKSKKQKMAMVAEEPMADQEMEMIGDEEAQEVLDYIIEHAPVADLTEDEDKELATKPHLMLEVDLPFGGAQSWRQMEEFRSAQSAAAGARQTSDEFEGMIKNILADDSTGAPEKASRFSALAAGFAPRVEVNTDEKKDADPSIFDVMFDKLGLKQLTKREAGANFVASDFADVPDRSKPSTWKLRLAEGRSGNFTVAQVARAITAMQPSGFRGQRVDLGSSKSSVTGKVSSAIGKIKGASDAQKTQLRERLAKVKSTGFQVFKDMQGNSRWFGWVSNKWRDRDTRVHPDGEIISEEAHKEYVEWAWKEGRMPELWIWHTPRTAMEKRADWLDYAEGFLLASGPLSQKEAAMFDRLASKYDLAMSHGFFKDWETYDKENGIISKYRGFEDSVLPREFVANEWTDFATLQEAKDMGFAQEHRGVLVDAFGEERVVVLESDTKENAEYLKELGIEFKATEMSKEEVPEEEVPEDETVEAESAAETEEVEPAKAIDVKVIAEALGLPQLDDVLKSLTVDIKDHGDIIVALAEAVKDLKKTDDEKVAEVLTPRIDKATFEPSWIKRLSQSEETEISEEKEKEIKEGEGAGWVSEAMGEFPDPGAQVPIS